MQILSMEKRKKKKNVFNKYLIAFSMISKLTPRDMLKAEIKFSVNLVREACEKALKYDQLNKENKNGN